MDEYFVKTKIKFKNQLYNTFIKNGYEDNDYNNTSRSNK